MPDALPRRRGGPREGRGDPRGLAPRRAVTGWGAVDLWRARRVDGALGDGRPGCDVRDRRRRGSAGARAAAGGAGLELLTTDAAARAGARGPVRAAVSRVHHPPGRALPSRTLS